MTRYTGYLFRGRPVHIAMSKKTGLRILLDGDTDDCLQARSNKQWPPISIQSVTSLLGQGDFCWGYKPELFTYTEAYEWLQKYANKGAVQPTPPELTPSTPFKAALTKDDPPGWYLCSIRDYEHVMHWDGKTIDDSNPHIETSASRSWYAMATNFRGPLALVDVDF